MEKLNALAAGIINSVSGNLALIRGPNGTTLHSDPQVKMPTRCYVLSAGSATLDATIPYDTIAYDLPVTNTTALLGTLSGGVFTFTKEGFYLTAYFVTCEMDLSGATTATPPPVTCDATIQLGGVDYGPSYCATSAAKTPNFDGFVTNSGAIEQSIDLSGLESFSNSFETSSFITCDSTISIEGTADEYGNVSGTAYGWTCGYALNTAVLEADGTLKSTVPTTTPLDVTTSMTVISGSTPTGTAFGNLSGSALVQVIRNSSGVIKILDAGVERSPTISVNGTKTDGYVNAINGTMFILQI